MFRTQTIMLLVLAGILFSVPVIAQTSPPASDYSGSVSAGLALTGGNTDTNNFNIAFGLVRDPKTRNVIKANGLYLRGDQNNDLTVDRTTANLRDEYTLSGRTFAFGQMDYFRDKFKQINYLLAPTGGLGYKLLNREDTSLLVTGGVGGIWEKNVGFPVSKSGAVTAGQSFSSKITPTLTLTQSLASLFKMNDFGDSLSNFAVGVSTSINKRLELKVEFLDSYKNQPALFNIKKNDTAFVTALVFKFQEN